MAKKKFNNHYHSLVLVFAASLLIAALYSVSQLKNGAQASFDAYGYNYKARIFNGSLDGADRNWDGTYWGDKTYAKDKLVMKWSKAWDEARFNGKPWTQDAWVDNEFNGKAQEGSGEVWHYKIVWVGPELEKSPYWRAGGYPIWGQFEVIFSQGTANKHFWEAHAHPSGYGMY
jgi:hypothetical protein